MKWPLIAAVTLASFVNLTPRGKADDSAHRIANGHSGQNETLPINGAKPDEAGPAQKEQPTNNDPPQGDETAQWVLVIVGAITAGFIGWQSWETKISARAAKRNSDAFINSERAWIVINKLSPPLPLIAQPIPGPLVVPYFAIEFVNSGRTVARVTDAGLRFHTINTLEQLPTSPDYSGRKLPSTIFHGRPVAPRQEFGLGTALESGSLTQEQLTRIRDGKLVLCIYGFINYSDFSDTVRTTQFCYVYTEPVGGVLVGINDTARFEIGGPSGYNRYT